MPFGPATRRRLRFSNYASARNGARRALPRVLFDFIDGGADDERTLRDNSSAFGAIALRPRQAVDIEQPGLATRVLGAEAAMPVALAPCGGSRLVWPEGERALVRAAGRAGIPATLSTAAGTPVEEATRGASGPVWFQLYYPGTRAGAEAIVARAEAAGCSALFVTVDMPLRGNQERVRSAERIVPPRPSVANAIRYAPQLLARPGWTWRYVRDGMTTGVGANDPPGRPSPLVAGPGRRRPNVTWADIDHLRRRWRGPLVVKGVLTAEDARRCLDCGADGIVVSNHGGRQLDTAPATIRALPEVVEAVGGAAEVLLDGGVRRGTDVVKALALGARAVLVGRPYLYGLAIAGEAGVTRVLELYAEDLARTLRLLGRPSVQAIDAGCVEVPATAFDEWLRRSGER